MEPYAMTAAFFGTVMVILTTRELVRKKISPFQYLFWMILWLSLILVGTVPYFYLALVFVTQTLGMYTPIHFVTTFSILILFAVTYVLGKRVAELNEKLNKITQHIALMGARDRASGSRQPQE